MQDFEPLEKLIFLAVLVYDSGEGRCCEVPRSYLVSHPEIAYRLAMHDGQEERYGNKFVGISVLEGEQLESRWKMNPAKIYSCGDCKSLRINM